MQQPAGIRRRREEHRPFESRNEFHWPRPEHLLRARRPFPLVAVTLLVALVLAPLSLAHHVRRLGYMGVMRIPGRAVRVVFEGGTCVHIEGPGLGGGYCCLGHPTCPRTLSARGVTVYYAYGWFFVAY